MEQQELGKTEEVTSSAELSGLETAPAETAENLPTVEASESDAPTATEVADNADSSTTKEVNGIKRGALIEGVIINTSPTAIVLDLGNGKEGIIQNTELERMDVKRFEDFVVGKTLNVVVINPRNKDGKVVVSYNHALEETDWQNAEQYAGNKEVFYGKIGGYNKGGLIVRFGRLRGFIPQSQISEARLRSIDGETPEQRYGQMINQNISVKVMEVDRTRNRLILSERAADREVRQQRKEALITELQPGELREGTVVSLETFGAFVDIGGAEGLVHLTELSHHHITHPRQAVSVGQKVQVKVIGVDPANNRIALSMKEMLPDPWDDIAVRYAAGTLVRATITKTAKFGAFARIEGADNIEGLIHISELADDRVEDPKEVVKKGDVLTLRVVKVDIAEKRLGLSLKKVFSPEFLDDDIKTAFERPELVEIPAKPQTSRAKAAVEKAREKGAEVIEALQEHAEHAKETVSEVVENVQEKGADVVETLQEHAEHAKATLTEVVADIQEKGADIIEALKEKLNPDSDTASEETTAE